jgi:hypothetical protein
MFNQVTVSDALNNPDLILDAQLDPSTGGGSNDIPPRNSSGH